MKLCLSISLLLLLLFCLECNGFVCFGCERIKQTKLISSIRSQNINIEELDNVQAEAEAALEEAQKALMAAGVDTSDILQASSTSSSSSDSSSNRQRILQALEQQEQDRDRLLEMRKEQEENGPLTLVGATTLGGGAVGLLLGFYADIRYHDFVFDLVDNVLIFPATLSILFAALCFAITTQKSGSKASMVAQDILGVTTNLALEGANRAASKAAQDAVQSVKDAPNKVAIAAKQRVQETVEEISATPGRVATEIKAVPAKVAQAASRKARATADEIGNEIKAVPNKIVRAASDKAAETARDISQIPRRAAEAAAQKTQEAAQEVQQLPRRAADAAARKARNAAQSAAREVQQLPRRAVESVQQRAIEAVQTVIPLRRRDDGDNTGNGQEIMPPTTKK